MLPSWVRCGALELLLALLPFGTGLYDPVHHIESARIYGNIDAFAYYYVDLLVGSPPQRVSVIVDTGSGVTAFPCKSCRHCGSHLDPSFDFSSSTTAKWIECGKGCTSTCQSGHCGYRQAYTEGSAINGWWFRDQVRLGDGIQRNPPVATNMGCHQYENKLFYTQKANGILGIRPPGRGTPTLLQELFADKTHIDTDVFSLCLAEWGGRMVVGGHNASYHRGPIVYVPLQTSTGYYGVPLTAIKVDGREVTAHMGHTMIDSGTTYVYMASNHYVNLRRAIEGYCSRHESCGAKQQGTCWEVPKLHEGLSQFPSVELMFQGQPTAWVPSAYLYRKGTSTRWCYAFEDDGPGASTVLGAAWMLQHEVIFDLRSKRLGIAPASCPEFRKRPEHDPNQDLSPPTAPPAAEGQQAQAAEPGAPAASAPASPEGTRMASSPVVPAEPAPTSSPDGGMQATADTIRQHNIRKMLFAGGGIALVMLMVAFGSWAAHCSSSKGSKGSKVAVQEQPQAESGQGVPPAIIGAEVSGAEEDRAPPELSGEEDPLVAAVQDKF